jgi:hypothetical protein
LGQELLSVTREFNPLGAISVARNRYGVDLCQQLHLCRRAAEEGAAQEKESKRSVPVRNLALLHMLNRRLPPEAMTTQQEQRCVPEVDTSSETRKEVFAGDVRMKDSSRVISDTKKSKKET